MDATLAIRAAVNGVTPEVYERMEMFSITDDQAQKLLRLSVKALQEALEGKLTKHEILQLATDHIVNDDGMLRMYSTLVNQLSTEQIASLGQRKLVKLHEFLQAGFSVNDAIALCQQGGVFSVRDAIDAREHGIPVGDLVQAWAVRYDSDYVQGRKSGATHTELLEILSLTEGAGTDFGLSDYIAVTSKTIATHAQVVAMLHAHKSSTYRRYYAEFVLGDKYDPRAITHNQAMEVLKTPYFYPSYYWQARGMASHAEVLEIAKTGMKASKYAELRENNPRFTHDEIVQLANLEPSGRGLPLFIRLIDDGYTYADIQASGMSVSDYHFLRANKHGPSLTQEQVLEVKAMPLTVSQYRELREEGIPHDTILTNVM